MVRVEKKGSIIVRTVVGGNDAIYFGEHGSFVEGLEVGPGQFGEEDGLSLGAAVLADGAATDGLSVTGGRSGGRSGGDGGG